jgi:hypothetical protein
MDVDRPDAAEPRRGREPEDLLNRNVERRYDTPRQYEEEVTADDPVMPADDSTLNTKI